MRRPRYEMDVEAYLNRQRRLWDALALRPDARVPSEAQPDRPPPREAPVRQYEPDVVTLMERETRRRGR